MPAATATAPQAALTTDIKNRVLTSVIDQLAARRTEIIEANKKDLDAYPDPSDRAMYDRLIVDEKKVDGMIGAVRAVLAQADPVGRIISEVERPNGLRVVNRSVPFGTILIIYESRPDVTVEAAVLAFKAGSKILLKGGKEARHSNRALVDCWQVALRQNGVASDRVRLLEYDRAATQEFLREPTEPLDLIVPRGGDRLITFVREHARCAVLVSGRGNNFLYADSSCDWEATKRIVVDAKTAKISACNALDKVLLDSNMPAIAERTRELVSLLEGEGVKVLLDATTASAIERDSSLQEQHWDEEFLAMRCVVAGVASVDEAIELINAHSGGHSASILTENEAAASDFMLRVDCAAVYHNASTRFTDGGEMGAGAELAISTDKLHHRGPLGLRQLVTNKYFVYGSGQTRSGDTSYAQPVMATK